MAYGDDPADRLNLDRRRHRRRWTFNRDGERFDLATESFTPVAMPGASARAGHTATLLTDGRVLVAGGVDDRNALATSSEIWNIELGIVVDAPGLQSRTGHTAILLADGQVLLAGGTERPALA